MCICAKVHSERDRETERQRNRETERQRDRATKTETEVGTDTDKGEHGSKMGASLAVGSSSQADCLLRNSAMDDSIGGS